MPEGGPSKGPMSQPGRYDRSRVTLSGSYLHKALSVANPVQIFLSSPVVLLSFISRFALVRYQIYSNTTGSQQKNLVETLLWAAKGDLYPHIGGTGSHLALL